MPDRVKEKLIERFAERLKEAYPKNDRNNPSPAIYYDDFCDIVDEVAAEIIDSIANGVTVQEWISVKDRLPEGGEIVIICTEKGFVYAGELIGDTWFLDNDSWTTNVTHWMPLPQPPKGERL